MVEWTPLVTMIAGKPLPFTWRTFARIVAAFVLVIMLFFPDGPSLLSKCFVLLNMVEFCTLMVSTAFLERPSLFVRILRTFALIVAALALVSACKNIMLMLTGNLLENQKAFGNFVLQALVWFLVVFLPNSIAILDLMRLSLQGWPELTRDRNWIPIIYIAWAVISIISLAIDWNSSNTDRVPVYVKLLIDGFLSLVVFGGIKKIIQEEFNSFY